MDKSVKSHTHRRWSQSQRCRCPRVHVSQTVSGESQTGTGSDVIGQLGHVVVVRKQYSLFVRHVLQRLGCDAVTYAVQQVDDHACSIQPSTQRRLFVVRVV